MPSPDDVERRLSAVEGEVARLREQVTIAGTDAAAARVLAAGADRDVSEVRAELRAHTRAVNALRETQLEMQEAQSGMQEDLRALQEIVTAQDARMSEGFATLHTGMSQIVSLLQDRETGS